MPSNLAYAVGCTDGIEMDAGYAVSHQLPALPDAPLDANLAHLLVGGAFLYLVGQLLRDINFERLGYDAELREFFHRLDAGDDGARDARCPGLLHEREVFPVVVEQLGDGIFGARLDFLLEPVDVGLQVGCLIMFFRIARHAVAERRLGDSHFRAIHEDALIEIIDLFFQLYGMGVPAFFRDKYRFVLGFVSTEHQEVGDAEELEVEQGIFRIFTRVSAAQDVGHDGDAIFVLDGGCYGYRSRATAQADALKQPVAQFLVDIFAAVGRDVDVFRVELPQQVDGLIQAFDARPFQGREYFEGESRFLLAIYQVNYSHFFFVAFVRQATEKLDIWQKYKKEMRYGFTYVFYFLIRRMERPL